MGSVADQNSYLVFRGESENSPSCDKGGQRSIIQIYENWNVFLRYQHVIGAKNVV